MSGKAIAAIRRISALAKDERGVSAVEFAFLVPLMMTLYFGAAEVTQAVAVDRKVTLTTRAVTDLASQVSKITNADMTSLLAASSAIITPYPSDKLKVTLSLVKIDANKNATIEWSDTLHGTARTKGSSVTLPAALAVANTSLLWGEASYDYKPTIGYMITGTKKLSDQIYMRPRLSETVTRTAS